MYEALVGESLRDRRSLRPTDDVSTGSHLVPADPGLSLSRDSEIRHHTKMRRLAYQYTPRDCSSTRTNLVFPNHHARTVTVEQ
jgi:hypothetical protein